jgi:catechol 2,3-dioxygenase-like lactoylglutathione lyase family enzyme
MIQTHGLTHISLAVRDPQRALYFYAQVFGVKEYFRSEEQIQAQGPGPYDVLAFERSDTLVGKTGGITHFGFRLRRPDDISHAVAEVQRAGGRILRQGEFAPGYPYAYVEDLDGHEIELWYE